MNFLKKVNVIPWIIRPTTVVHVVVQSLDNQIRVESTDQIIGWTTEQAEQLRNKINILSLTKRLIIKLKQNVKLIKQNNVFS